jgi:AbrB family looped-hinge helix DNA binding protein
MSSTQLSSKGQVIIPKALRDAQRWTPGTRLQVVQTPEGLLLSAASVEPKTPLQEGLLAIRQRIGYTGPPVSIEAMNEAVLAEAARRHRAAPSGKKPR